MLQLIDITVAAYHHTQPGHAKIFGFFAARDKIEPLRNYVYRRGIDNYKAVSVKRNLFLPKCLFNISKYRTKAVFLLDMCTFNRYLQVMMSDSTLHKIKTAFKKPKPAGHIVIVQETLDCSFTHSQSKLT